MTKEEFYSGVTFSILGIPEDLKFDQKSNLLIIAPGQKNEEHSFIEMSDREDSFDAFLNVFGHKQVVTVGLSACELK